MQDMKTLTDSLQASTDGQLLDMLGTSDINVCRMVAQELYLRLQIRAHETEEDDEDSTSASYDTYTNSLVSEAQDRTREHRQELYDWRTF
jgi:hypothetical protein